MAITAKGYFCDRCGKRIGPNKTLCKECDEWLERYVAEEKSKGGNTDGNS